VAESPAPENTEKKKRFTLFSWKKGVEEEEGQSWVHKPEKK
jgi:hypothetical protein